MLIVYFISSGQSIVVYQGNLVRVCWLIPLGLINISFKTEEGSTSDSSELMASCLSFDLLGVLLGPTMLEVISGYPTSKNDLFSRKRRHLADLEGGAADNWLKTDGLLIWELQ